MKEVKIPKSWVKEALQKQNITFMWGKNGSSVLIGVKGIDVGKLKLPLKGSYSQNDKMEIIHERLEELNATYYPGTKYLRRAEDKELYLYFYNFLKDLSERNLIIYKTWIKEALKKAIIKIVRDYNTSSRTDIYIGGSIFEFWRACNNNDESDLYFRNEFGKVNTIYRAFETLKEVNENMYNHYCIYLKNALGKG